MGMIFVACRLSADQLRAGRPGPARLLAPETVRTVADVLAPVEHDALRARFDPRDLAAADIYPQIWDEDADDLFDQYLWPHFRLLRELYLAAAKAGDAVLVAVT